MSENPSKKALNRSPERLADMSMSSSHLTGLRVKRDTTPTPSNRHAGGLSQTVKEDTNQVNETTLKIQHERLQKEVEQAIRRANTNDDLFISFEEFKNTMLYLHYVPNMEGPDPESQHMIASVRGAASQIQNRHEDQALLNTLWIYLNPKENEEVEKANTFDFLLLLIFNISRLSENEMCEILA
jgi:hypothetical protein